MMWGYGFNWQNMMPMMFGSIVGVVLLIVLVWLAIRWLKTQKTSQPQQAQTLPGSGPTAREILSQRYARGEIDATTFEQMRERLDAPDGVAPDGVYERSSLQVHRPAGEKLFDSTEIL